MLLRPGALLAKSTFSWCRGRGCRGLEREGLRKDGLGGFGGKGQSRLEREGAELGLEGCGNRLPPCQTTCMASTPDTAQQSHLKHASRGRCAGNVTATPAR